jgi:peptidoglycan/xylan/chitin deacetylase (PgdA/CDA1 family)
VPVYDRMSRDLGVPPLTRGDTILTVSSRWSMATKDRFASELWLRCPSMPSLASYLGSKRPYFSWDSLKDWIAGGHSVGFHTNTHPFCSKLSLEDIEPEILTPARSLKSTLSLATMSFSYPFGDRLAPHLESLVFDAGIFNAMFGIAGFSALECGFHKLERCGLEGSNVGWSVYRRYLT